MSAQLWVLLVEHSEDDATLIGRTLTTSGYDVHSRRVEEPRQMRAALDENSWDVIIADYDPPVFDAPAALRVLHETGNDIPFIVVSGTAGEEHAVAVMKAGAHDYVRKDNLTRLAPAVEREVREALIRRRRRETEIELRKSGLRLQAQQEIMEQQSKTLEKSEALLKEIHHRVKNNLQVVSSLLRLQARAASNPETAGMLEEIRQRIHAMALLHETVFESENVGLVDFARYIGQLIEALSASCGVQRDRIQVRSALQQLGLDLDVALPCGLIVNEVLSNSLRHAFPDGRAGEVSIELSEEPTGTALLVMADNGIGVDNVELEASKSLGFRLINLLARQLNAAVEVRSRSGTEFRLTFPIGTPDDATAARLGG